MGADRVKIPQEGDAPLRVRMAQIGENLLYHQLGEAVGIHRPVGNSSR